MGGARSPAAQKVKDEIAEMSQVVFHIVAEYIEKPHVSENVPESAVEEHEGKKGKGLFEKSEMGGDFRHRVPGRDESVKKDELVQILVPGELDEIDENVQGDEAGIHQGKGPGSDGVTDGKHGMPVRRSDFAIQSGIAIPLLYTATGEKSMNAPVKPACLPVTW
jgi:hypothetical protein